MTEKAFDTFSDRLLRRLFKCREDLKFTADELEAAKPEIGAYRKRLLIFVLPLGMIACAVMIYAAMTLYMRWLGPIENPVVDKSGAWIVAIPCALFALTAFVAMETWYLVCFNPRLGETVRRYHATKHGWDPKTGSIYIVAFSLLLTMVLMFAVTQSGTVIDENGLRFSSGFRLERKNFGEVTEIHIYDSFDAPIGHRDVRNLRIRFDDGLEYQSLARKAVSPADLERVAAYVADRSGVVVGRGGKRPD